MEQVMSATEQLARFRSNHRIANEGGRCVTDGIRVWRVKGGTFRHDTAELATLMDDVYGSMWPSEAAYFDAVAREVAKDRLRQDPYFENERRREAVERYIDDTDGPTACRKTGHIDGCPGLAGGDHELKAGWIAYEDADGFLVEVEVR